ncbi:MAG: hypothetical protein IPJ03_01645 [Ignavibacteriales bacterium]|nr:hypothetical protein [Ignavibacteriales bacterium]
MLRKNDISFSWTFLKSRTSLAEEYLSNNDRVGSSALAGAVIETALRKVVSNLNIPQAKKKICPICGTNQTYDKNIFSYLQKFERADLLDNKMLKLLEECRQIRNIASHGYFGELKRIDCIKIIGVAKLLLQWGQRNFPN